VCRCCIAQVLAIVTVVLITQADQTVDFENNAIILGLGGKIKGEVGPGRHWYGIGSDVVLFDRFDTTVE
jgi:hypothetical protein